MSKSYKVLLFLISIVFAITKTIYGYTRLVFKTIPPCFSLYYWPPQYIRGIHSVHPHHQEAFRLDPFLPSKACFASPIQCTCLEKFLEIWKRKDLLKTMCFLYMVKDIIDTKIHYNISQQFGLHIRNSYRYANFPFIT